MSFLARNFTYNHYNCFQPIKEAALGNIPTIAFCDTDSPMRYVDIGIPANNKGKHSIGCLFWLLARMVLQMRRTIAPGHKWDVMVNILENRFWFLLIHMVLYISELTHDKGENFLHCTEVVAIF